MWSQSILEFLPYSLVIHREILYKIQFHFLRTKPKYLLSFSIYNGTCFRPKLRFITRALFQKGTFKLTSYR
jgi:hypothetical protein